MPKPSSAASVTERIQNLLHEHFAPSYCSLENESDQHAGPRGRETHFRLLLVSERFAGLSRVRRHQEIYRALDALMGQPVHALSLHLFSPKEWSEHPDAPPSPACLGGSKTSP